MAQTYDPSLLEVVCVTAAHLSQHSERMEPKAKSAEVGVRETDEERELTHESRQSLSLGRVQDHPIG
ncbi:hypothetical protein ACLOJK_005719 [Asimina triloba]